MTHPTASGSDPFRDLVLSTLEAALRSTGDCRYRSALGIVRNGRVGGRPARQDATALDAMHNLLEAGDAATVEEAARSVSRTLIDQHSAASACERLARKYRRLQTRNGIKQ